MNIFILSLDEHQSYYKKARKDVKTIDSRKLIHNLNHSTNSAFKACYSSTAATLVKSTFNKSRRRR